MHPIPLTPPTTLSKPTSTAIQEVVGSAPVVFPALDWINPIKQYITHSVDSHLTYFVSNWGHPSDSSRLQTRVYQPSTQSTKLAASPRDRQSMGPIKRGEEVSTEGGHLSGSSWGHGYLSPIFVVPK